MSIRFHLDEHISAQVAAGLRRRNIDVTTAADADLIGVTDEAHLSFAASSGASWSRRMMICSAFTREA